MRTLCVLQGVDEGDNNITSYKGMEMDDEDFYMVVMIYK